VRDNPTETEVTIAQPWKSGASSAASAFENDSGFLAQVVGFIPLRGNTTTGAGSPRRFI